MLLTEKQKKALTHFIRLALSQKTAISLTELLSIPVKIEIADLDLCPLSNLVSELDFVNTQDVASVHQSFQGGISGEALLLWEETEAIKLLNLLNITQQTSIHNLDLSNCEVLNEIGSIILSSYLAILANINNYSLIFKAPYFKIEILENLTKNLIISKSELRYVFLVNIKINIANQCLYGYILLIANVMSLSLFIKGIETSSVMMMAEIPEINYLTYSFQL